MFVSIGGTDITKCVQETTYSVDSVDITKDWEDASGVVHKRLKRRRIMGSFDLVFIPGYTMDYADFLTLVNGAKTDNYIEITLDVNNLNTRKTINAYYTVTFQAPRKISDEITFKKCTFTVEER